MLDVLGNIVVDGGWQRQVEETVCLGSSGKRQDVLVEFGEGTLLSVFPADIRVPAEEGFQPLCIFIGHLESHMCMDLIRMFKNAVKKNTRN